MKRCSAILIFVFLIGSVAFPTAPECVIHHRCRDKRAAWVQQFLQSPEQDPKFSFQSVSKEEQQAKHIREELGQLKGHPWGGEYYFGDGLGVNVSLLLAPNAGFAFTWHGCLGLYDVNYGPVEWNDGKVKLVFTWPNRREGFEGIAAEFVPVRWGKRHYLIATDEMVAFTNAVNAGLEPSNLFGGRSGRFLLRRGDEKRKVMGSPEIPSEYASYLLGRPVRASIVAIGESMLRDDRRISTVTIDVGSAAGLKPGMELHVYSPSDVVESVILTAVRDRSADGGMTQLLPNDKPPAVGWKVSTKFHNSQERHGSTSVASK